MSRWRVGAEVCSCTIHPLFICAQTAVIHRHTATQQLCQTSVTQDASTVDILQVTCPTSHSHSCLVVRITRCNLHAQCHHNPSSILTTPLSADVFRPTHSHNQCPLQRPLLTFSGVQCATFQRDPSQSCGLYSQAQTKT